MIQTKQNPRDTLINQAPQMNHYAGISTSGIAFKASASQWVPKPNSNANGP